MNKSPLFYSRDQRYVGASFTGHDPTGKIKITIWDSSVEFLQVGHYIRIMGAYIEVYRGEMELKLGEHSSYEIINPPEEFLKKGI